MTDEEIMAISAQIDTFLLETAMEFQTASLELSAMVLARLMILNLVVEQQDKFRELLEAVSKKPVLQKTTKVVH
jgi:hypothetical protein